MHLQRTGVLRAVSAAAALVAALLLAAPEAATQRNLSISRGEIAASSAVDLHVLVSELRPDWLGLGGTPGTPDADARVLVYVDGRHVGDLRALRGFSPEQVVSLRLQGAAYVRSRDPRYPRTDFVAAIYVATSSRSMEAFAAERRKRWSVQLYAVAPVRGLQSSVASELDRHGYSWHAFYTETGSWTFTDAGREFTPGVGVSLSRAVGRGLWVEAAGEHVAGTWVGRIGEGTEALSTTVSWTDAIFLASLEQWPIRIGVGPIVRRADWQWAGQICGCADPESFTTSAAGIAGSFAVTLLTGGLPPLEMRAGARHFPSHALPESSTRPALDVGGTELYLTFGIGIRR